MPADDGLAPERQRLRKLIRVALKQKPYSERELYALVLRIKSVQKVNSPQQFRDALQILISQREISEAGGVYYHPDCKIPKPAMRDLDDDWEA